MEWGYLFIRSPGLDPLIAAYETPAIVFLFFAALDTLLLPPAGFVWDAFIEFAILVAAFVVEEDWLIMIPLAI